MADFNCGVMLDGVTAGAVSIDPGGRVKLSLFFDILLMVKADHFTVPWRYMSFAGLELKKYNLGKSEATIEFTKNSNHAQMSSKICDTLQRGWFRINNQVLKKNWFTILELPTEVGGRIEQQRTGRQY